MFLGPVCTHAYFDEPFPVKFMFSKQTIKFMFSKLAVSYFPEAVVRTVATENLKAGKSFPVKLLVHIVGTKSA